MYGPAGKFDICFGHLYSGSYSKQAHVMTEKEFGCRDVSLFGSKLLYIQDRKKDQRSDQ